MSTVDKEMIKRYTKAEKFLPWNIVNLYSNVSIKPNWTGSVTEGSSECFWFVRHSDNKRECILVDPVNNSERPVFDLQQFGEAFSSLCGEPIDEGDLPLHEIQIGKVDGAQFLFFTAKEKKYCCKLNDYKCIELQNLINNPGELPSPDLKWVCFRKNHNLYIRLVETDEEIALTTDGQEDYEYGGICDTNGIAQIHQMKGIPVSPVARWSPDSNKLLFHRLDQRKVRKLDLLQTTPGEGGFRSVIHSSRYPLPGDMDVPMDEFWVFDVEKKSSIKILFPPAPVTFIMTPIEAQRLWWNENSERVYFLHSERGDRCMRLVEADAVTGKCRIIMEETAVTFIEPNLDSSRRPNVRVLKDNSGFIWFSQRNGWGHLYLYHLDGTLRNQITQGDWVVRDILFVDEADQFVYFTGAGREEGRDPYYRHLYRASLDGTHIELLTPEDADHNINFSPSGRYFVDNFSGMASLPVSVLRDQDGTFIRQLGEANLNTLSSLNWQPPERFSVKARDNVTDLYGVIYRPTDFDPAKKYPILEDVYPGPQTIRTPKAFPRGFAEAVDFWVPQAMAELGFIVVLMDGLGTPFRSKPFHDVCFGNLGDAGGLEDHVGGLKKLAERYPYMDIDRVGIYGHSAGGFAAARAIFQFNDFYKVAVASAGNHDQRGFLAGWGEKYQGYLEGDNYDNQANSLIAENLKGKLLLIYGDMDTGVHPLLTLQVIDALTKANKLYDLIVLPNRNHFYMIDAYYLKRQMDYFVKHLLGIAPPEHFFFVEPHEKYHFELIS